MESKTVTQLRRYCCENKIRGYLKLKKAELIELIQNQNIFQFHNDVFSKPKKERELKIKCCGQYYKKSYMKRHFQSEKHQNYQRTNVDSSLPTKPKKATQIKCDDCEE
ncbi:hypothetical protein AVEN_78474-1 [Araneus ventricosus]|uniref:Uncharacterized protein n=1 Tax=Araneus ventricosus TaxID=182803 RepID=A0A4Y2LY73_ARAVE|nr:hypothetical protein AVEN_78474-1 [Araneus ventricosus]